MDIQPGTSGLSAAEVAALTARRLVELDRLRDLGIGMAGKLARATNALPADEQLSRMIGAGGLLVDFERVTRTVRQIVVLEFELRGLFKAPNRDALPKPRLVKFGRDGSGVIDREPPDLDDLRDWADRNDLNDLKDFDLYAIRTDYRRAPLDVVVADIRSTLGAEPPANDPFGPPPERLQAPPASSPSRAQAAPPRPAKAKPGMKIATPAKPVQPAIRRNGFRTPPTSAHNPNTSRKHRRNRGPPK